MPHELNPREVLFYLNELGYTNITAQQLKEFMIDLKKLLKYKEEKDEENDETSDFPCREKYKKQRSNEHEQAHNYRKKDKYNKYLHKESYDYQTNERYSKHYDAENEESYDLQLNDSSDSECEQYNFPARDVFNELYNTDTISSRAKTVKPRKKESVITVQINRPKSALRTNPEAATDTVDVLSLAKETSECRQSPTGTAVTEVQKCQTCSTARTMDSGLMLKKGSVVEKKGCLVEKKGRIRPTTSFIRQRLNTKPPKSDPVALFHQYQEEWKKYKIPGTENHSQIRWCIREKLLGDKFDYCY